jgi:hypothetical protein
MKTSPATVFAPLLAMVVLACAMKSALSMRTHQELTRRHLMQDEETTTMMMMMMEEGGEGEGDDVGGTTGLPEQDVGTDEILTEGGDMASLVGVENITISTNSSANQSLADAGFEIVPELEDSLEGTRLSLPLIEAAPVPTGNLDVLLPENELDADPDDLTPTPEEPGME